MSIIKQVEYHLGNKILIIRNVESQDAEELIQFLRKIAVETNFLLREPDEFTLTIEQQEKFIQEQQDSEVNLFILAEVEGKIVGTCSVNGDTRRRIRHTANLGISIEKDHWGIGIGKKLMQTAIQWAKGNGISRITLQVDTENFRALNLYLKLGFEVEGTLRNEMILSDGSYRNAYTMALLL
ncbi:MAG: GNAT family N-acetyltransferase [Bacillota bacterium]